MNTIAIQTPGFLKNDTNAWAKPPANEPVASTAALSLDGEGMVKVWYNVISVNITAVTAIVIIHAVGMFSVRSSRMPAITTSTPCPKMEDSL